MKFARASCLLLLLLPACLKSPDEGSHAAVTVTPSKATVPVGGHLQLTATVSGIDDPGVLWTVEGAGTIGSDGNYAAPGTLPDVHEVVVRATSIGDPTASATAMLTLVPAEDLGDPLALAISPPKATLAVGATRTFTVSGLFADGSSKDVTAKATWSLEPASVATAAGGVVTAVTPGIASLRAKVGDVSAAAVVTVSSGDPLASLSIEPATLELAAGTSAPLTAWLKHGDGSKTDVTATAAWAVDAPSVATVGVEGAKRGVVTAVGPGTATVSATLEGQAASAQVTVKDTSLTAIAVSPSAFELALGATRLLTATGTYSDGSTGDVTASAAWTSTADGVAAVDSAAIVTAKGLGTAKLHATLGAVVGEATVAVTPAIVVAIEVSPSPLLLPAGLTADLTAKATYSDGTSADVGAIAAWSSTAPTVASVDAAGHVTAVSPGTATLQAAFGGATGSAEIVVGEAALLDVALTPSEATLAVGQTLDVSATGTLTDGTTLDVTETATWASDAPAAAIEAPGVVAAKAEGDATVTATVGALSGKATIHVAAAVLAQIVVSPAADSVAVGLTRAFTAKGFWSDGSSSDLTTTALWSSEAPAVADVSPIGVATGFSVGDATIVASLGGVAGTASLTVTAPELTSLAVSPAGVTVSVGTTHPLSAMGTWSDGTVGPIAATWASLKESVATVSSAGLVKGVAAGAATVTATAGGMTAEAKVIVSALALTKIAVSPASPSAPAGETQAFTATATWSNASTSDVTALVTWASDAPGIATVSNAAGSAGLATAHAVGSAKITATSGSVTGAATLTVTLAAPIAIAVAPATATVAAGATQPYTATGTFAGGKTGDVTSLVAWKASAPAVATISPAGLAKGLAPGSTDVVATVGAASGKAALIVTGAVVTSLAVSPSPATLPVGKTLPFTATATWSDGKTGDATALVAWSSSAPGVATVATGGLATAVGPGLADVRATLDGVSASAPLTVVTAALASIEVTPGGATLAAGLKLAYAATGTYTDGSTSAITNAVSWSAKGAATVSPGGLVTGTAAGTATISAEKDGIVGSTPLTVTAAVLVGVGVSPSTASVAAGAKVPLVATASWSDGTSGAIDATWSADPPSVASVSPAGVVTGLVPGKATITASAGGFAGTAEITVGPPEVATLVLSPPTATVSVGAKKAFTATATFTDGTMGPVTSMASWASSDPLVAAFGAEAGIATGVAPGSVTVSASSGGVTGKATLTVTAPTLTGIAVTPATASVPAGLDQPFTAKGTYSDGSTADLTAQATWTALPAGIANVSAKGVATGVVEGSVTIAAAANGVTGSATLTVTAPILTSVAVSPKTASLAAGQSVTLKALAVTSDGATKDVSSAAAWQSDATGVATVQGGVVKAVAAGTANITATYSGLSGKGVVTVLARYLTLKVGAKWTYLITDTTKGSSGNGTTTVEAYEDIGGAKAGVMAYRLRQDELKGHKLSWQQDTGTAVLKHKDENYKASGALKSTVIFTPSRLRVDDLPAHTTLGAAWTESNTEAVTAILTGLTVTTSETDQWTIVAVDEPLTVPAGTFPCLRIHRVGVNVTTDKTYWFARGVGKVKELDPSLTEVLVSYTLP